MISSSRHRRALGPLDGLFLRLDLDHPVAADAFLGFGERTVGDLRRAAVVADAHAGGRRLAGRRGRAARRPSRGSSLYFIILRDGFGVGHRVRWRGFVTLRNHQHHETHVSLSLLTRRTTVSRIDIVTVKNRGLTSIPKRGLTPKFNILTGTAVAAVTSMAITFLASSTVAHAGRRYCRAGVFGRIFGWFVVDLLGSIPNKTGAARVFGHGQRQHPF